MSTSTVDLTSCTHRPGDLFTTDEIACFARDGFVVVRGLADSACRDRMLHATFDGLADADGPLEYEAELHYPGAPLSLQSAGGRTVRRLKQAHCRGFVFTEWVTNPAIVGRLQQLLGPEIVMPLAHHNCIMTKQPRFSSDTGWHQDIRYWSFQRPELVNVWLALTREHADNGCLKLIPGTHRMSFAPERLDAAQFLREDLPENSELITRGVPVELDPGDVLFFHSRSFHAASRNYTDEPKFSVVFTFRPADNPPLAGTRSASLPELRISPPLSAPGAGTT